MKCRRLTVLAMSLLFGAGCYSYRPLQTPQPGMEVRARLTSEAAVRRSQGLDVPVLSVEGRVVESSSDGLSLDVLVARNMSTFQAAEMRDTVRFENAELVMLQERKLSTSRTALFTVATVVAAVAVIAGLEQVIGGTENIPDPGTPNLRAPFGIHVPRSIMVFRLSLR